MPTAILEADLRHLHLGSLLQLSEAEFVSGHLVVETRGRIALASGCAVGAETADGALQGIEALYELFLETTGPARIELDPSVVGAPLAPTISLVMEGCRLLDEWTEIAETRFVLKSEPSDANHQAAIRTLAPVVRELPRRPTLQAAVAASGVPRTRALGPVRTLIDAGVFVPATADGMAPEDDALAVERTSDTVVTGRPLSPAPGGDPVELLGRGRVAFRAGRLEEAEALWSHALALAPNDRVLAQNLRLVRQRLQQPD